MQPSPTFVRVVRALAFGGALIAFGNPCVDPHSCYCAADAGVDARAPGPGMVADPGWVHAGVCTASELDAGCGTFTAVGGPLAPPDLALT